MRARIEKALASKLGLRSHVVALSAAEVLSVVRDNPASHLVTNPSHWLVLVPRVASDLRLLKPLLEKRWTPEVLALGNRVGYLWCTNGVARSPLWAGVDHALERTRTARDISTLTKAAALLEDGLL